MKQAKSPPPVNEKVTAHAKDLLGGKGRFIDSIRALSALRFEVSEDGLDPDFQLFVVIDSETDHLPPSKAAPSFSQAWLARCTREEQEVALFYASAVQAACAHLLERFST